MKITRIVGRTLIVVLTLAPILGIGYVAWTIWREVSGSHARTQAAADRLLGARFYSTAFEDYGSSGFRENDAFVSFDPALPFVYIGKAGVFQYALGSDSRTVHVAIPDELRGVLGLEIVLSPDLRHLELRETRDYVTISGMLDRDDQGPWLHGVEPMSDTLGL